MFGWSSIWVPSGGVKSFVSYAKLVVLSTSGSFSSGIVLLAESGKKEDNNIKKIPYNVRDIDFPQPLFSSKTIRQGQFTYAIVKNKIPAKHIV